MEKSKYLCPEIVCITVSKEDILLNSDVLIDCGDLFDEQ